MKHLITTLLFFAVTFCAKADFVISTGSFSYFDGKITVETQNVNGFIHYMILNDKKAGGGCTNDRVLPSSGWFIYPESTSKIWIFEGADNLKLIEINDTSIKFSDTKVIPALIDDAPQPVREKYLKGIQP